MPTYEYKCLKCKKKFEQLQSITAAALKKCPKCGGKVERLIGGGAGLIFKGTGFYITDYKRKSAPAEAPKPADKAPAKDSGAPPKKPSEKKTDAAE